MIAGNCPCEGGNCKLEGFELKAWETYCEETAGSMDVRDFWCELPAHVQRRYLRQVTGISFADQSLQDKQMKGRAS